MTGLKTKKKEINHNTKTNQNLNSMKRSIAYLLVSMCLLISIPALSQSKKDLDYQIKYLISEQKKQSDEVQVLKDQITLLKSEMQSMSEDNQQLHSQLNNQSGNLSQSQVQPGAEKSINTSTGKCQAITSKGTQCSRNAAAGSNYCWQHKGTSQANSATGTKQTSSESSTTTKSSTGSSNYNGSNTIQTGPRGGQYYINKNGNKTYVKRK